MDHARLACSAVSSIAGVPFAEFTDFQPCCVTLTRKLAGVTGASRRGREGTHQRSCRVPSALVDRRNPTSNPTRGHRRQWLLNAAKSHSAKANQKLHMIGSGDNRRPCRIVSVRPSLPPTPAGGASTAGQTAQLAALPLCSLVGSRLTSPRHVARQSHRPVTSPRHMARQSHGPSRALTAWPQVRAVPVLGKRYGP